MSSLLLSRNGREQSISCLKLESAQYRGKEESEGKAKEMKGNNTFCFDVSLVKPPNAAVDRRYKVLLPNSLRSIPTLRHSNPSKASLA